MEVYVDGKRVDDEFVSLDVRVGASEIGALERGAYLVVAQRMGVDLSGGLSPREILELKLGADRATALVLEAMKSFVAPFALSADGGDYSVVGAPAFDEGKRLDETGNLLFTAEWVRLPKMELSSYGPVEITVPPINVDEAEIDARVDEVADSYKTIERDKNRSIVEDGAIVQISMECAKDGERFPQLCFEGRPYRAGSGQMPEGFDEALIGARVGQTVHVDFLLPMREDIDGTMTGPSITAEVKVDAVMREVGRMLTDEFVRDNMPNLNSLADLREQSRKEIEAQKTEQMRHYTNYLAAGELAKRLQGSMADSAYDAVADQMVDSLFEQARAARTTPEELLEQQGSSMERFRMMSLMQARDQLRQGAALDAWARHRGIEVADADIDAFFELSSQGNAEAMREEAEKGGYLYLAREGALRLKASEDLVSSAIVHVDESLKMPLVG